MHPRRTPCPLGQLAGTAALAMGLLLWWPSAARAAPAAERAPADTAGNEAGSAHSEQAEDEDQPYVFQKRGGGHGMSGAVQVEVGYGTRATRFFGEEGVEQGLRLRFQPWEFLNLEGWGGLLVTPEGDTRGAGAFDVTARALRQSRHYLDLHLGGGYLYDYRGRNVLRVRAALARRFGRFDLQLGSAVEVPLTGEGDEVDVMVAAAASYRVTRWYRQGLEVGVEDLEGFWEPEESEGGAKVLFGPTAQFLLPRGFDVRLNVSAVYAHLVNQSSALPAEQARWGLMGRLLLGYTFY